VERLPAVELHRERKFVDPRTGAEFRSDAWLVGDEVPAVAIEVDDHLGHFGLAGEIADDNKSIAYTAAMGTDTYTVRLRVASHGSNPGLQALFLPKCRITGDPPKLIDSVWNSRRPILMDALDACIHGRVWTPRAEWSCVDVRVLTRNNLRTVIIRV
jgi:hypothetical protein